MSAKTDGYIFNREQVKTVASLKLKIVFHTKNFKHSIRYTYTSISLLVLHSNPDQESAHLLTGGRQHLRSELRHIYGTRRPRVDGRPGSGRGPGWWQRPLQLRLLVGEEASGRGAEEEGGGGWRTAEGKGEGRKREEGGGRRENEMQGGRRKSGRRKEEEWKEEEGRRKEECQNQAFKSGVQIRSSRYRP